MGHEKEEEYVKLTTFASHYSVRNYEKFVGHEHEHVCEVVHKIFLCMVLNATRINDE